MLVGCSVVKVWCVLGVRVCWVWLPDCCHTGGVQVFDQVLFSVCASMRVVVHGLLVRPGRVQDWLLIGPCVLFFMWLFNCNGLVSCVCQVWLWYG